MSHAIVAVTSTVCVTGLVSICHNFPHGNDPPALMKTSASMFVATATCGSTPNAMRTGTVMRDVLPVTTLMLLVRKKTAATMKSLASGTRHLIKAASYLRCDGL
jgi:hypothetical protein